jgi:hypothetical protein
MQMQVGGDGWMDWGPKAKVRQRQGKLGWGLECGEDSTRYKVQSTFSSFNLRNCNYITFFLI